MRKTLDLILLFLRRNLVGSSLILIGFPILMIVFVVLTSNDTTTTPKTTIVNLDEGVYASTILEDYEADLAYADTEDEASLLLEERNTDHVLVIPVNFSSSIESADVPSIKNLTRPNTTSSDQAFLLYLQRSVERMIQEQILSDAGIQIEEGGLSDNEWQVEVEAERFSSQEATVILLMTFSILYGSAILGQDLVNQRKNKVLYRGLATPTSGFAVMTSNVAGAWLIQIVSNLIAIFIITIFTSFSAYNLAVLILMVAILCFYSVSQQLLFLRLFKNPQLSMFIGMMLAVVMMFMAMLEDMKDLITAIPEEIFKIAYISPFYWVMESFEQNSPLIPAAMLFLLSIAVFVAGGFRIKSFAD